MTADDTVTAKLAEWEALAEGATEGPWTFEPAGERSLCGEPQCCSEYWDNRIWGNGAVLTESHRLSEADAAFIAAARTAMPALIAAVKDVRAMHVSSSESRGVGRVDPETGEWGAYCDHDGEWWPCPTEQALTKWIGGA